MVPLNVVEVIKRSLIKNKLTLTFVLSASHKAWGKGPQVTLNAFSGKCLWLVRRPRAPIGKECCAADARSST